MIHIADTKVARRYGDFFIRQIHKFEEVRERVADKPEDRAGAFKFFSCFFLGMRLAL